MATVSIILPTFDRRDYLEEAAGSVLAQTFEDWELIIVDDGSTDTTVQWVESLDDARITLIRQPHSGHEAMLRNIGILHSSAPRVAFIDSDDRWTPTKLERQLAHHDANPRFRWSYTGRRFIDAAGAEIPQSQFASWVPHSGWILEQVLTHAANIALPSVMVERSLLLDAGGFNEMFRAAEDYELWVRLAERSECGVIEEPLLEVRKHKSDGFQRPDVSLGFAYIYRDFRRRSSDPRLRREAKHREALSLIAAADRLGLQQRWGDAFAAVAHALRVRPLGRSPYAAGARLLMRRMASRART